MTDLSPTVDATLACPSCGTQNEAGVLRCRDCGTSLVAVAASGSAEEARGDLELEEEWRAAGVAGFDTDLPMEAEDRGVCPVCGAVVGLAATSWEGSREVRDTPSGRKDLVVVLVRCPTCATPLRSVIETDVLPPERFEADPPPAGPGDDRRQYTGEPVETDEGWVLPQQQNVGIGNGDA